MTAIQVIVGLPCWEVGGVTVFSTHLVRGLRARGFPAHIVLTEQNTQLVSHPGVSPYPSDAPVELLPVSRDADWGAHWRAMIQYLEERAPCIYLPNHDFRHSCVSSVLSDRVAVVSVLHTDEPVYYDHAARLGRYWNRVVTVSSQIAAQVEALGCAPAARPVTIPIGVPVPKRRPCQARPGGGAPLRVVYHGRLAQRQKRILDLPRILAALRERRAPVELTIAGGGPDEAALREACHPFVAEGIARFTGPLPHAAALDLLARQDVFLLTSDFEGLPHALLEAMAHGCVPVVTDVRSGIPELVRDGVNGYRVPVGDTDAFADRLACLQQDASGREQMSKLAYETVAEGGYDVETMVERYVALFSQVESEMRLRQYSRPRGRLLPPPREVEGTSILPGEYGREIWETESSLAQRTLSGRLWRLARTPAYYARRGVLRIVRKARRR